MNREEFIEEITKRFKATESGFGKLSHREKVLLGIVSDIYEKQVKNLQIADVVKSLPTDECVEQWWAEGQDQNKNFWHEAPYRTNGDVVEEIKAALKYFIETWQR